MVCSRIEQETAQETAQEAARARTQTGTLGVIRQSHRFKTLSVSTDDVQTDLPTTTQISIDQTNNTKNLPPSASMFSRTRALARSLAPLGDRVLIRRAPKEVQTASGIYLPSDTTKDPNEGEVVAVGPGEKDVSGNLHPVNLTSGDTVLLPEYGGMKVKIGDEELFLFRESDILGKFQ